MTSALRRMARRALALVPRHTVVRIPTGENRGARWEVGASSAGCWLGRYEPATQRAMAQLIRPGMTVLDVGANVGFFTLLAARLAGPTGAVHAFEPFQNNARQLMRHVQLNHADTVTVHRVALDDSTRAGTLYVGDSTSGSLVPQDQGLRGFLVSCVALDDWRRDGKLPARVGVVKMDIEGAEGAAILGMLEILRADRPALFIALHGGPREREMRDALTAIGYELRMEADVLRAEHRG